MNVIHDSSLGRTVTYPTDYDPGLLFPIERAETRRPFGIDSNNLPFIGHDRWQAYELGWIGPNGKPAVAEATLRIPCDSPCLIESKSLKLYLNSLNQASFADPEAIRQQIAEDLSQCAQTPVEVLLGLPATARVQGQSLDEIDTIVRDYGPPNPALLQVADDTIVTETWNTRLFKSNCPVTGQPDWASVHIHYTGNRIEPAQLLRYLISYRRHAGFHEQCVERIFSDVLRHCKPQALSVEARYTRRGGLDINPWRATPGYPPPIALRDPRQ